MFQVQTEISKTRIKQSHSKKYCYTVFYVAVYPAVLKNAIYKKWNRIEQNRIELYWSRNGEIYFQLISYKTWKGAQMTKGAWMHPDTVDGKK